MGTSNGIRKFHMKSDCHFDWQRTNKSTNSHKSMMNCSIIIDFLSFIAVCNVLLHLTLFLHHACLLFRRVCALTSSLQTIYTDQPIDNSWSFFLLHLYSISFSPDFTDVQPPFNSPKSSFHICTYFFFICLILANGARISCVLIVFYIQLYTFFGIKHIAKMTHQNYAKNV